MTRILQFLFGRRLTQADIQAKYNNSLAYKTRCIIASDRLQTKLKEF